MAASPPMVRTNFTYPTTNVKPSGCSSSCSGCPGCGCCTDVIFDQGAVEFDGTIFNVVAKQVSAVKAFFCVYHK